MSARRRSWTLSTHRGQWGLSAWVFRPEREVCIDKSPEPMLGDREENDSGCPSPHRGLLEGQSMHYPHSYPATLYSGEGNGSHLSLSLNTGRRPEEGLPNRESAAVCL